MADDVQTLEMPPGYSSVMVGAPGGPPATPYSGPVGQADADRATGTPVDESHLWDLTTHANAQPPQNPNVQFEHQYTPQQAQMLNTLNNQRAVVGQALAEGRIRPQDAQRAMQNYDLQAKSIQPMQIPKVKPPSAKQELADNTYTDPNSGMTYLRQKDGSYDIRPISQHAAPVKAADQLHDAQMAHADDENTAYQKTHDRLHEAVLNPPQNDPQLPQTKVQTEQAKTEMAQAKADSAQHDKEANAAKLTHEQQVREYDAQTKEYQRQAEEYAKFKEGFVAKEQKKADADFKAKNKGGDPNAAAPPINEEDFADKAKAAWAKHQADLKEVLGERPTRPQVANPYGSPTLAPPQEQAGQAAPAAPQQQQSTNPAMAAGPKHPALRPDAPPELHAARYQIDQFTQQYGADPAKWPPDVLAHAKQLTQALKPYRASAGQ